MAEGGVVRRVCPPSVIHSTVPWPSDFAAFVANIFDLTS